jgi:hypothetical protein
MAIGPRANGVRAVLLAEVFGTAATSAYAQPSVNLTIANGQVNLVARNAPIQWIFAEWARVGGATIVNAERIPGGPQTLELAGLSEKGALEILLRGVAGYVLAPRREGSNAASAYDRILILPTSKIVPRVPVAGSQAAAAPARVAGTPPPAVLARFGELGAEGRPPNGATPMQPTTLQPPPAPPDPSEVEPAVDPREVEAVETPVPPPAMTSQPVMPPGSSSTPGVIVPVPVPK